MYVYQITPFVQFIEIYIMNALMFIIVNCFHEAHKALYYPIVVKVDHSTFSSSQSAHHCIISLRLSRY